MAHSLAVLLPILLSLNIIAEAQTKLPDHDTTYFTAYPRRLTTRLYYSRKYTRLGLVNKNEGYSVRYDPNTTHNLGIGATYKWATLNLAYGWPFLNNEQDKGKTHYLDLQLHAYTPKFNIDVLGQFYRGFYLSSKGAAVPGAYYRRPDLNINIIGGTFQYVFNHRKFSFRAAALQSEWQKKSAGTPLLGVEVFGGTVRSDSTIVPTRINQSEAARNVHDFGFYQFGVNGGYAYTLVIHQRFFATGAATINIGYGYNRVSDKDGDHLRFGSMDYLDIRLAAGYNSKTWGLSITYVNTGLELVQPDRNSSMTLETGNLRANLLYHIPLSNKNRKQLNSIIN